MKPLLFRRYFKRKSFLWDPKSMMKMVFRHWQFSLDAVAGSGVQAALEWASLKSLLNGFLRTQPGSSGLNLKHLTANFWERRKQDLNSG